MKRNNNNKGFTIAELLIVVAIIAVMVAIAIPTFGSQLEKSREGVDASNIRSMYSDVMTTILADPDTSIASTNTDYAVSLKQAAAGWANGTIQTNLEGLAQNSSASATSGKIIVAWATGATSSISQAGPGKKVNFKYEPAKEARAARAASGTEGEPGYQSAVSAQEAAAATLTIFVA